MIYQQVIQVPLHLHYPGYTCEPHNNPADFFLDIINGDSTAFAIKKLDIEGMAVRI